MKSFTQWQPKPKHTHLPELIRVPDGVWAAQFGVQVVVDTAHLSYTNPVLAFERKAERSPTQVGRHIEDKACYVGESYTGHISGGNTSTNKLMHTLQDACCV